MHPEQLEKKLGDRYERVVGIRPTGWSYRPRGGLEVPPVFAVCYLLMHHPAIGIQQTSMLTMCMID
jgi:hypothetical protein